MEQFAGSSELHCQAICTGDVKNHKPECTGSVYKYIYIIIHMNTLVHATIVHRYIMYIHTGSEHRECACSSAVTVCGGTGN